MLPLATNSPRSLSKTIDFVWSPDGACTFLKRSCTAVLQVYAHTPRPWQCPNVMVLESGLASKALTRFRKLKIFLNLPKCA